MCLGHAVSGARLQAGCLIYMAVFFKELIELLYLLLLLKITAYINQESLNVKGKRILSAVFKTLL